MSANKKSGNEKKKKITNREVDNLLTYFSDIANIQRLMFKNLTL